MLDASYYRKTDEIISRYVRDARSLIPIMQDIQAEYRYLPAELLSYVAKEIGISQNTLFLSRSKNLCAFTVTSMMRSPGAPPFLPAEP